MATPESSIVPLGPLRVAAILLLAPGAVALAIGDDRRPAQVVGLTQITAVENTYPAWSPDGSAVVFESTRDGDPEVFVMNADGSELRQLTFNNVVDGSPVFSPDGSQIAFVSDRDGNLEVYLMEADGGNPHNVSNHPGTDGHPKFSADGHFLVFNSNRVSDPATFADGYMSHEHNHEIFRLELSTGSLERLTDFPGWDTYPSLSPDGQWLLWRRSIDGLGRFADKKNSEIFVKNLATGEEINVSQHPDFDGWPAWSPDGAQIAFSSNRAGAVRETWDLYVMSADGSNPIRLTFEGSEGRYFTKPAFSPDGGRLLATRTVADTVETFVLDIGEVPRETPSP